MNNVSLSAAIRQTLHRILQEDERALLMGEDIGRYGGAFKITRGFLGEFGPERIVETPISEGGFVSAACGAALMGSRPIVEIMFMDFLILGLDALVNIAVKWQAVYGDNFSLPLVIRTPAGGGRAYGPTHSQSFEGLLMNIPQLTICCPSNPADAAGLLLSAHRQDSPCVFIEPKSLYARKGPMPDDPNPIPLGSAKIVRPGRDISLFTYGRQVVPALRAADFLAKQDGIQAEVVDLRTIKPLDTRTIKASMARTGRGLSIEESPVCGGVGAEISAVVMEQAFDTLEAPFIRLGAAEHPIFCSPELEQQGFPNTEKIVLQARKTVRY